MEKVLFWWSKYRISSITRNVEESGLLATLAWKVICKFSFSEIAVADIHQKAEIVVFSEIIFFKVYIIISPKMFSSEFLWVIEFTS